MSTGNTITKTVWQYSEPLSEETMVFLKDIALDYSKVKKYVYNRYSGIGSLDRLTPAYDIMGEVRNSGIRTQLKLPSAYFSPAVVDAVADIKTMWGVLKNKLRTLITANENLSSDDRIYLRTVLKLDKIYAAILNHREYELPDKAKDLEIDVERLNSFLGRLTRKYLTKPQSYSTDYFNMASCGYTYRDGAIYIASRTPGRRLEIPLTDNNVCKRQIRLCIRENYAALALPVEAKIKKHTDYDNTVYVHIGYHDMFTLSNGNIYGQALGAMTSVETQRLEDKNRNRARIRAAYRQHIEAGDLEKADRIETYNLGSEKYKKRKDKERAKTEIFINTEINRMIESEKPNKIVITRPLTIGRTKLSSKSANRKLSRSFNGYIRERLSYKCRVHSIELVEINSKGTGSICSCCGAEGKRLLENFQCPNCGYEAPISLNGAKNIESKYNTITEM